MTRSQLCDPPVTWNPLSSSWGDNRQSLPPQQKRVRTQTCIHKDLLGLRHQKVAISFLTLFSSMWISKGDEHHGFNYLHWALEQNNSEMVPCRHLNTCPLISHHTFLYNRIWKDKNSSQWTPGRWQIRLLSSVGSDALWISWEQMRPQRRHVFTLSHLSKMTADGAQDLFTTFNICHHQKRRAGSWNNIWKFQRDSVTWRTFS